MIDALTNTPIQEAVTLLPLPPRMRESLVSHTGPGRLLAYAEAIEQGELGRVARYLPHPARDYASAVAWASETAAGIHSSDDGPLDDEYV